MDTETRTKALEEELQKTREELNQLLLDIRSFIMEVQNPMKQFEGQRPADNPQEGR